MKNMGCLGIQISIPDLGGQYWPGKLWAESEQPAFPDEHARHHRIDAAQVQHDPVLHLVALQISIVKLVSQSEKASPLGAG